LDDIPSLRTLAVLGKINCKQHQGALYDSIRDGTYIPNGNQSSIFELQHTRASQDRQSAQSDFAQTNRTNKPPCCTTTMGFMENLRNKVELYRLEQRYTKRDKRTTFISTARYVDGEYVYHGSPLSVKSSNSFGSGSSSGGSSERVKKVFNRQSKIF